MLIRSISNLLSKCLLLFLLFAAQNTLAVISTPNQKRPNNNDTVETSPYFYIDGIKASATQIELQYSEDISMSNPLLETRDQFNTAIYVYTSKLKLGTDYYWRVRVRSATDSSLWSSILKFTTTSDFRATYPYNNLDNIRGSIQDIHTNKVHGFDTILVQRDTSSSFNSTMLYSDARPDTGTHHNFISRQENLHYGQKYYWRAIAYSGTDSTNWTATLYFITGDTIGLKYPTPAWLQDVETEVEWSTWRDEEPVQIQLDTSPSFSSPLLDTFSATGIRIYPNPRFTLTDLDYETQYYYRARSYNTADTTPWAYSSFTTDGFEGDYMRADNYSDPIVDFQIRSAIDGSVGYEFLLDTIASFDSDQKTSYRSTNGRDTAINLIFGATYYVKARPYHSKDTGGWTRTRPVRITPFPATYYPFRNYTDIGITDSMQIDNMNGVDAYEVQVADSGDYENRMFLDTVLLDSTNANYYFIKGLTFRFNTQYEWRIRAWHPEDTSDWSDSKKFTTVVSPTLTRPFNSDFLGDQAALDLQWESEGTNVQYQVMLDTSTLFDSPLLIDSMVDTNAMSVVDLLFRPLYHWKVRIVTSDDTSAWSDTWKFTVLHSRLNNPRNNRTNVGITSLDWNSIAGTDGYILQVDSFSDFSAPLEVSDTVKNSFFHYFTGPPSYFTFNTKYYWRVKLYHSLDTTEWSDVWNFTTTPRRSPTLLTPLDSAIEVPVISNVTWNAYSGASSYAIEYATNPEFISAAKVISTTTSVKLTLAPNTRYYWRARGRNSDGAEFYDWSEHWTFVTNEGIPAVTHISPANGAVDQEKDIVLRWNKNNDATSYQVELSTKPSFAGAIRIVSSVAAANYNNLNNGSTYYWRVKTNSNSLSSPYSEVWSFTVKEAVNSIAEETEEIITLYPNPSSDYITLSGLEGRPSEIQVLNSLGVLIKTEIDNGSNSITLDVQSLANGTYQLLINQDGMVIRKTFSVIR